MIRPIHPFPARMAPELAIAELTRLSPGSIVLDPMSGSGTVVRHAAALGLSGRGFDVDPLAVLMTKVWTTPVDDANIERLAADILVEVSRVHSDDVSLPWIDEDRETSEFVDYWFGPMQQADLRKIAYVLARRGRRKAYSATRNALDIIKLAFSRIIITKDKGASLARDVSHSRPHRVAVISDYKVIPEFEKSIKHIRKLLEQSPILNGVCISVGDARNLKEITNSYADCVMTSPPYLNAIDYMRGHRLSLVWLGYKLQVLRDIRSESIGAERGPNQSNALLFQRIYDAMTTGKQLLPRHAAMINRYSEDMYRSMSEISRVLKPGGKAVLVVGNSCLKGSFVRNSDGIVAAGEMVGLNPVKVVERELPMNSRYLPITSGPLGKRMRTESIISFSKI